MLFRTELPLMIPEYELKTKDVHKVALQTAKKHFSLKSNGYQCDTEMLFNKGRKSYRTTYTFTDGISAEVVLKATPAAGKNDKLRRKWLAFIAILVDWTPKKIYKRYWRCFGIERFYRMMRQVRVITTSKNPALRRTWISLGSLTLDIRSKSWIRTKAS